MLCLPHSEKETSLTLPTWWSCIKTTPVLRGIPDKEGKEEKMLKIHSSHPEKLKKKKDNLTGGKMDPFLKSMYVWELEFGQGNIIGYVGFNFFHACGLINCITFNLMMRYRPQCWINPGSDPSWIVLLIPCGHLLEFPFKLIWSGNQMLRTGPITVL